MSLIPEELESVRATCEELYTTLEELQVAEEDLREHNEQLAAAHEAVEAERQCYQELFEFAPDGYLVTDTEGVIQAANRAVAMLLNCSQQLLVGKPLVVFVAQQEHRSFYSELTRLRQVDGVKDWEVRVYPRDGEAIDAALSVAVVRNRQGELVALRWLLRDITERKQNEKIRRDLEKEKELSQLKLRFFSMVSHEYRTPLSTILVSAQLLQHLDDECPKEKRIRNVQRIEAAAKHMINLLNNILIINRAETGKLEFNTKLLDLEKFCINLVKEIQISAGNQYTITFVSQGPCKNAYVDEKLLRSILANLLSNAIRYSPEGGEVHFALTCEQGEAIFRIHDEGIGIPPEDQQQLFEPFHRGKNVGAIAGTGLGLTVVKKCVDMHGGRITVASEVGVGTTSTVMLPLNPRSFLDP